MLTELRGPNCTGTGEDQCRTMDSEDWEMCMAALRSTGNTLDYFEAHTKCHDPATEPQ